MDDPLASLLIDETEMARDELAEALRPYVRLTRSGDFVFEDSFDSLPAKARVACVLLALKAGHLLGLRDEPGAAPQEIVAKSGLPPGTVRPKLSELLRDRVTEKQRGRYSIPAYGMRKAAALLRRNHGRD